MVVPVAIQSNASTVVENRIRWHPPERAIGFVEGSYKCVA
jgi:hypothetical protein